MSSIAEGNANLVRSFIDRVWNELRPDAAAAFLAADYRDHAYLPGDRLGLENAIGELGRALPDARSSIEDLIASGDRVAVRIVLRGTHLGEFRNHPASGVAVEVKVTRWYRLADGKIAEHWALFDTASFLRQIGSHPKS
ncbi:MAG TPA: ester cyclase [Myxococcaceae bacterium]|nr:ester cyclase [Myxococcaceae bacterium]